jgi:translocation and assembly module TamA
MTFKFQVPKPQVHRAVPGETWTQRLLILACVSLLAACRSDGTAVKPTDAVTVATVTMEIYAIRKRTDATEAQVRRLFGRADQPMLKALEPFGYYQATIDKALTRDNQRWRAKFEVSLGKRTQITDIQFRIDGPASEDSKITAGVQKIAIQPGEALQHQRYEQFKSDVQRMLLERGYLDAEMAQHRVEVQRAKATAQVKLTFNSGVRYAYAVANFQGAQFSDEFMQRYINFKPGELYTQKKLLDLQQRLLATDYFSTVEIAPETDDAKDGQVPISIAFSPAKRLAYTYGVNYGTDSGFGVRAGVERRWVNARGHKYRVGVEASQRLTVGVMNYDIPLMDKARTTFGVNLSYRDETTDIARTRAKKLGLSWTRERKGWTQTLASQWLSGDFDVGGTRNRSTLLYPELIFYKRVADDLLYPREGYSVTLNARAGSKALLSDTNFANLATELQYIRPAGDQARLIFRGTAGALWTDDFDLLPPEIRFFAGGDRSVRGYRYQALGPLNNQGRVRGGKYLATLSSEYEYALSTSYAIAGFADVGNAFDAPGNADLQKALGFGLRWYSPVGVVRLDVGYALDRAGSPARLHLVIGPDL